MLKWFSNDNIDSLSKFISCKQFVTRDDWISTMITSTSILGSMLVEVICSIISEASCEP